jgi:hypothetical protein
LNVRETTVSVAGVPVVVRSDSSVDAEVIDELFGGRSPTDSPAVLTVSLVVGHATLPGREPDVSVMELRAWRDASRVTLAAGDVVAIIESSHATIVGPAERLAGGVGALRIHVLAHLFALADVHVVHGALLSAAAAGVLVIGTTGTGKSTSALAAHERAGWCAHADDVSCVRRVDAGMQVAAIGFPLHVPADLGGASPARASALPNDQRNRRVLPVQPTGWRPLTDVVVVGHGEAAATAIVAIEGRHALQPLLESFPGGRDPLLRGPFVELAGALCRLRTWHLALGRDPTRRLASTMAALDVIAAANGR